MKNLLTSLIISITVVTIASPSFAGDDHEDRMWDRDKKEQRHHSKKDNHGKKENHSKKERQLHAKLDILIDALVVCPSNSPERFVDNGDGTICDHETGLMWEKKNAEDGQEDFDNPRDVDNKYTWTDIADGDETNPDGTAFTDFLARLNGVVAYSESSEQLGGYSDWRLPTSAELQTILDPDQPGCGSGTLCMDPIFVPANPAFLYWSSTSFASNPLYAWGVVFTPGSPFPGTEVKSFNNPVRAVRGGR